LIINQQTRKDKTRTVECGRGILIEQLRNELGANEDTEHLVDWLEDAWETLDLLRERFGESRAMQLYTASVSQVWEQGREKLLV
jgi:hypothetical protein